ncbi:hypothetical protein AB8B21_11495 [Tardiphaga sp. 866_E4_N2_1]|uniref:hypothetical protein n=1 Tax=unclassified Tardiphaga TaxID=2631404 RepID=UPI003F20C2BC
MSDLNPKSLGRLALGGFFVAFADVEMRIGEVLKSLLKAEGPHQDFILAAIGNFAAKTNAIKAGLDNATSYGSQPGTQDRPKLEQPVVEMARKAMSKALALNEMRVKLAHGHLAQMDDGSFVVTHLKIQDGRQRRTLTNFRSKLWRINARSWKVWPGTLPRSGGGLPPRSSCFRQFGSISPQDGYEALLASAQPSRLGYSNRARLGHVLGQNPIDEPKSMISDSCRK